MSYITLIRPPIAMRKNPVSMPAIPPIGLAYVASSLREAGHHVDVIDAFGENVSQLIGFNDCVDYVGLSILEIVDRVAPQTQLIGVSCMFSQEWPGNRALIEALKSRLPSVPIMMGGEHATALCEYIMHNSPAVDFCVLGEGEETVVEFVQALFTTGDLSKIHGIAYRHNGQIVKAPRRGRVRDIDSFPVPAWDLFPVHNYLDRGLCTGAFKGRTMPILATRGCPFQCTFCSSPNMWTQRWIARNPRLLLEEMKWLIEKYQVENFEFSDLTAIVKKQWTVEFSRLLLESGLRIEWQLPTGTRSEAIDAEVCNLLYKSGCRSLVYAPESGSPTELKRIKKALHLDRTIESMKSALRAGINVRSNFVLGFPGETHREVLESFKFLFKLAWIGVHDITHFVFVPYPGTELFEELRKKGRIQELNDEYFTNLLAFTELNNSISYTDYISSSQLAFYRIAAQVWFYGLMFLFRPWRLVQTLFYVFQEKQRSRMEVVLKHMLMPHQSPVVNNRG